MIQDLGFSQNLMSVANMSMRPSGSRSSNVIELDKAGIRFKHEHVIETSKKDLVAKLSSLIGNKTDREEFQLLCQRVEEIIRLKNHLVNEKLMELFSYFNPVDCAKKLEKEKCSKSAYDRHRDDFLELFFNVMEKSNFKLLPDDEWNLATSSKYLVHLPTKVNKSKLDTTLFEKKLLPKYSGKQFAIFRRGIGLDRTSGYFFKAKVDVIFSKLRGLFVKLWKWIGSLVPQDEPFADQVQNHLSKSEHNEKYHCFERIHVSNSFRFKDFFKVIKLQEPTFEHMIILYRKNPRKASFLRDTGIHLKHYSNIPMADMELILPEKKTPGLPKRDWIKLFFLALVSAVIILQTLKRSHTSHIEIVFGIIIAFMGYCAKVYVTFYTNLLEYERLISKLMHDKQLDCGHGTLLHVCDEAIQQEVKEAILAYYVLMTEGEADEKELGCRCNALIRNHFSNDECEFEVNNAIGKLVELKLVTLVIQYDDLSNRYKARSVQEANKEIGETTYEKIKKSQMNNTFLSCTELFESARFPSV